MGETAPILHPYRYGTVLLTVRSHTPLAIHRAVRDGMGAVLERYGDGTGTVCERLELRYGNGMGGERYGMVGFGIRERYGSSIGAAVWDLV